MLKKPNLKLNALKHCNLFAFITKKWYTANRIRVFNGGFMGLEEWVLNKFEKKINEELGQNQNENLIQNDEIEKASYSEYSYKKVKKLREKGKYWGYDVPYLQHPVNKQEKPRAVFIVAAVLFLLLSVAMIVFTYVITRSMILPLLGSALGLGDAFAIQAWDIFGLFATFTSLISIFVWLILVLIVAVVVAFNIYFISQTIKFFKMSKISMQEMAKGFEVGNLIIRLGAIMAITVMVGITILVLTRGEATAAGIWLIIGVMLAIIALISPFFVLLIVQRNKAKKQFAQLSEEQQKDFIRHNQMLDRVNRKSNRSSKSLISSTKVDF